MSFILMKRSLYKHLELNANQLQCALRQKPRTAEWALCAGRSFRCDTIPSALGLCGRRGYHFVSLGVIFVPETETIDPCMKTKTSI
jgi:hypothetical protein